MIAAKASVGLFVRLPTTFSMTPLSMGSISEPRRAVRRLLPFSSGTRALTT